MYAIPCNNRSPVGGRAIHATVGKYRAIGLLIGGLANLMHWRCWRSLTSSCSLRQPHPLP
jgi:hypothetical protein